VVQFSPRPASIQQDQRYIIRLGPQANLEQIRKPYWPFQVGSNNWHVRYSRFIRPISCAAVAAINVHCPSTYVKHVRATIDLRQVAQLSRIAMYWLASIRLYVTFCISLLASAPSAPLRGSIE
jgi:hypothetical protein